MLTNQTPSRWVSKALDAFVSGLDVEADGVAEAVFGFCLDSIAGKRVPASVKATLFDKVYCSASYIRVSLFSPSFMFCFFVFNFFLLSAPKASYARGIRKKDLSAVVQHTMSHSYEVSSLLCRFVKAGTLLLCVCVGTHAASRDDK